jgi:N-acetylglucosamine-6-phosphate deacetylase
VDAEEGGGDLSKARVVKGRGIAVGTHLSSYGAAVRRSRSTGTPVDRRQADVRRDRSGQIVNPGFVENQITGMLGAGGRAGCFEGRGSRSQRLRTSPA